MNTVLRRIGPEWALRLGLGAMYIYSGFDLIQHPRSWILFMPFWLRQNLPGFLSPDLFLQLQGGVELLFAAVLLAWFLPRRLVNVVAFLSAVELAAILLFFGIDLITFRDIGLLGASAALWLMTLRP